MELHPELRKKGALLKRFSFPAGAGWAKLMYKLTTTMRGNCEKDLRYVQIDVPYYAAPARATDYSGLPPTCTFVGGIEPFCDETVAYVENLRKCGVETRFRVFPGCFHAFDMICPETSVAREAATLLKTAFRHAAAHYFSE